MVARSTYATPINHAKFGVVASTSAPYAPARGPSSRRPASMVASSASTPKPQ